MSQFLKTVGLLAVLLGTLYVTSSEVVGVVVTLAYIRLTDMRVYPESYTDTVYRIRNHRLTDMRVYPE